MSTSKAIEIQQESYTLHETPAIPFPFEVYLNAFSIVHFLSWTLWLLHILTHLAFAYQIKQDASHVPWRIWIAVLSDLLLAIPELLTACNIGLALCTGKAAHPRPSYRLHGRVAPSVDIMITACGEPADMVINTVAAAAAQDYPPKQFRIFVLDDSRDADLRHAVDLLKLGLDRVAGPQVIYLSRTVMPGQPSYFKSGNLRFGIEQSQRLGEGSMLLAGLDADMIPEPSWLRQMVPHLLLREEVAIACGPQRYYNVPSSDPLGQQADFDIYFTVQELLNDYLGAPMCTGTGYVARRSAIAEIGGWPLAYTGEDYMCSALLTGAGWDVVFVRSFLQTGLAPESLTAAMKQRMRWTDAGLEVHQRLGPYLSTSTLTSRMKPSVRAVNMIYIIRDYSPLTTILGMLLLPLVLIPTPGADDDLIAIANKHGLFIFWAQTLFLATHMARTLRPGNVVGAL
ncbi:hypothetical protein MMC12_007052 [Toensbergia leucococca]|nr:hypothetical protein [Toensbergia leucococca]